MKKPVQIEVGEWYFKGCFIQKQEHPNLPNYIVFKDTELQETVGHCMTLNEAKALCKNNEVKDVYLGLDFFTYGTMIKEALQKERARLESLLPKGVDIDKMFMKDFSKNAVFLPIGKGQYLWNGHQTPCPRLTFVKGCLDKLGIDY